MPPIYINAATRGCRHIFIALPTELRSRLGGWLRLASNQRHM